MPSTTKGFSIVAFQDGDKAEKCVSDLADKNLALVELKNHCASLIPDTYLIILIDSKLLKIETSSMFQVIQSQHSHIPIFIEGALLVACNKDRIKMCESQGYDSKDQLLTFLDQQKTRVNSELNPIETSEIKHFQHPWK